MASSAWFVEQYLKNEKGLPVSNYIIHDVWHEHILWCREHGKYAGIIAPMGHSKTESLVIGLTLFYLAEDQNYRIKIVCNSNDNAKDRVSAIKKYVEEDKEFQQLAPEVVPAYRPPHYDRKLKQMVYSSYKEEWQKHQFSIKRTSKSKDASVEAWGVLSSAIGGRADIIIFDDIVDMQNTLIEPANQPKVKQMFSGTWLSRLEPQGFAIYIATPWTDTDNTAEVMDNPQWSFCNMAISEDLNFIEVRFNNIDHTHPCFDQTEDAGGTLILPLWEAKWDKQALLVKKTAMSDADFARGYHCRPFSHKDLMFQHFKNCCDPDTSVEEYIQHIRQRIADDADKIVCNFVTGVDLSSKTRPGNVIFTVAVIQDENVMVPVDIRSGKWTSPEVAEQIREVYQLYKPTAIYVENNALQGAILQWMEKETQIYNLPPMPLEGYMTGKQKSNPTLGVPGMEVQYKNKMWRICTKNFDNHDTLCDCSWCVWVREVKLYPFSASTDSVMAMWFAQEAARKYCGLGSLLLLGSDYEELKKVKTVNALTVTSLGSFYDGLYSTPAGGEEEASAAYRW